jgi:hypothetical protein
MQCRSILPTGLLALTAVAAVAGSSVAQASGDDNGANRTTIAVIGDTPYGADQVDPSTFGALISDLNADPFVRTVIHVGDIKNGSTVCSDEYFDQIAANFEASFAPVIYTPGDNEWTDCHRPAAGGYNPYERLARIRETFFAEPGETLGVRPMAVTSQVGEFVENVMWTEARVKFSTVHVTGSSNGASAWSAPLETPEHAGVRAAEVARRQQAAIDWIDATFDAAAADDAPGVVVNMQADTFSNGVVQAAFVPIIGRLAERAAAFGRPVLLIQGDSHNYIVDNPLPSAPNVTRIVVEGETVGEWLRLTVDPHGDQLFSWVRVER